MKNACLAVFLYGCLSFTWAGSTSNLIPPGGSADSITKTLATFQALAQSDPEIANTLERRQKQRAIVFVPGILGSKLTAADGQVIFGDLSDYKTLISRLQLPDNLIDESTESGIKAELLLSLGPMDLYGDAIGPMQQWAQDHHIQFVTCGYDWRRDIRSGSRDLEKCLKNALGDGPKDIVLIAHSMGGLVTWDWMMRHEAGHYSQSINVISVAILGSPLEGSCEIIRMIQSGYIQPTRNDQIRANAKLKPIKPVIEKWVDAFVNRLSGQLTQGIRPLVLSWPGAIELSPPPMTDYGKTSCVGIPADAQQPIGSPGISYYTPAFWQTVAGKDMLRREGEDSSYEPPPTLTAVLGKATEFRNTFKVKKLNVPVWLYYSQIWLVPSEAGYRAPHISPADQWTTAWGDGRVPANSASVVDNPTVFSYRMGLDSVHGNLPADPNFFDDYFQKKLPGILDTALAVGMLEDFLHKPAWISAYAKLSKNGPDVAQLHASLEPMAPTGKESLALTNALTTVTLFNNQLCKQRTDCAQSYGAAKGLVMAPGATKQDKLMQYASVVRSTSPDRLDYAYAEGNRGLVLARSTNWRAATVSLSNARQSITTIESGGEVALTVDSKFTDVVDANLGKSLYESGQCQAAEPYLRKSVDYWSFAKTALTQPCNDAPSGLQYCFDTHDYCRKSN